MPLRLKCICSVHQTESNASRFCGYLTFQRRRVTFLTGYCWEGFRNWCFAQRSLFPMADKQNNVTRASEPKNESALPEPGVPVWVWCGSYRTLACRDEAGIWHSIANGKEIKGPVQIVPE